MECKHRPTIRLKGLFSRKPEFTCRHCGVTIEMDAKTQGVSRVLNSILVAAMIFKVLGKNTGTGGLQGMAMDMGVLFLYILIYLIAYLLLMQFGNYLEKEDAAESVTAVNPADTKSAINPEKTTSASQTGDESQPTSTGEAAPLTQEQLDLMALYQAYAKDNPEAAAGSVDQHAAANPSQVQSVHEQVCIHEPVKSWKNYIPSNYNFVCAKCGKPISLTASTKKSMNLAMLAVVLVILMPSFTNNNINYWQYGLLTLLAFAVAGLIQFIYLRKAKFDLRR